MLAIFQVGNQEIKFHPSTLQEREILNIHGGKRTGAGRRKGERTRAVLDEAEAGGEMPIAYC